ncbi:MAG: cytochrome c oxidase subunit II [Spirochaeta sp.]|nr:cytochrome c oxidase subunit II [Spirochaeta sp.]RPG07235.1 MAG: cytochrome c oxidase subunit II [Proteobacteria bacterium TMED72]
MTRQFSIIRVSRGVLLACVAWVALFAASQASANDMARGKQLYALCAQCHTENGMGAQLYLAPAIAGLDEWYVNAQLLNFRSGIRGTNWQDVGGLRMHPMSRWLKSDEDVSAVAAYVSAMPKVDPPAVVEGGDPVTGKALYATCASCHGPEGQGMKTMNAPPLVHMSDWYLVSSLEKFKAGIRGWNPQNTNAVMMRGMSNLLPNEQAIKDVVAYITTLNVQEQP